MLWCFFIDMRPLVAFSFPVVFLIHGSRLIAIYLWDFVSSCPTRRVFFLFAEFISVQKQDLVQGQARDNMPLIWQVNAKLVISLCHRPLLPWDRAIGQLPEAWQESCCNQSEPAAPGRPPRNSTPVGPKCHSGAYLYRQACL